jgi:hypothetical protein
VLGRRLPGLQPSGASLVPSSRTSPRANLTEPYYRTAAELLASVTPSRTPAPRHVDSLRLHKLRNVTDRLPDPLASVVEDNVCVSGYAQATNRGRWLQFRTRTWSFTTV